MQTQIYFSFSDRPDFIATKSNRRGDMFNVFYITIRTQKTEMFSAVNENSMNKN